MTRWPQLLGFSILAGALHGLSVVAEEVVGTPLIALAFFAPVPLLVFLARGVSGRRAFFAGWIAGTTTNAIALYWIKGLLEAFAGFPWFASIPVASLLCIAQGLLMGFAALFTEVAVRQGAPRALAFVASVLALFSLGPALFPWNPSVAAVGWLPWAQLAEVGGTPLLDLMTVGVGAAAWHALHHRSRPAGVLAALLVALPLLYGVVRIAQVDETRESAPVLRVGVIQPNVAIYDKHDARLHHGHLVLLQRMTQTLERLGADVVIWPESAYPFPFPRGVARDVGGRYAIRQRGVRGPLLVGAVTRASRCDRWNSALAIDDQGFVRGVADKVELLAFGETVPLWHWLPPLQSMFPCPGLRSAAAPKVLTLHEVRYGVLNCYEDVLGRHARTVAGLDPELLVNITNDAWFGDTLEPHLHQLVARVRSIETRRDLVRAVNTGVSAHIDATGRTRLETETFTQDSFIATARRLEGTTVWVTIGDVVTPIAYAYLLAWGFRRRRA